MKQSNGKFAADFGVQVRLKEMELHRPRQWELVGWLAIFTSSWGWIISGPNVWPTVGRELAGAQVLKHKEQLFGHLRQRWQDLFGARFEVLLYDLTR